ncbi:MAG: hypothetical protein GX362_02455 [Methanosarcinaceae archaeon]|nr:hypothetical protein [Methanosarcinaceae archaeon]
MNQNTKIGIAATIIIIIFVAAAFLLYSHEMSKPQEIKMDYYYLVTCGSCKDSEIIIKELEEKYPLNITKYDAKAPGEGYDRWTELELKSVPCIVMEDGKKFYSQDIKHGRFEKRLEEIMEENENKSFFQRIMS